MVTPFFVRELNFHTLQLKNRAKKSRGTLQQRAAGLGTATFTCGRRFRIFAVVDDYSRECVRLIADTSISGARVARELDTAILERLDLSAFKND
jgi:transposase InsO family protein